MTTPLNAPAMTEMMWAAMRGRLRPECPGCGYQYARDTDASYAEHMAREAAHNARCDALAALGSMTPEERAMTHAERMSRWLCLGAGRRPRIRCGNIEARRSLLREHADGSCHDTQGRWWPAGKWVRK